MALGKSSTISIKSTKSIKDTYEIIQKVAKDMKLKVSESECTDSEIKFIASEPMKWITTNWPVKLEVTADVFQGNLVIQVSASGKGVSITQDSNTNTVLSNFTSSLQAYL